MARAIESEGAGPAGSRRAFDGLRRGLGGALAWIDRLNGSTAVRDLDAAAWNQMRRVAEA